MIELNVQGVESIRATFARLVPEAQAKVLRGLAQVAFDTAQAQLAPHDKPTGTGALLRSLRLRSDGEGGWIIGHNQQHAPYAPFVHWGMKTHSIDAKPFPYPVWYQRKTKTGKTVPYLKRKRSLRWPTGAGGNTGYVFAMHVDHPGYAGDPWLEKAADEAVRQFDAIVRRVEI